MRKAQGQLASVTGDLTALDTADQDSPLSSLSEEELTPPIAGETGAEIRERKSSVQGKIKGGQFNFIVYILSKP